MTHAKNDEIQPIQKRILLSEEYDDKYDAYSEITDAFEYNSKKNGLNQDKLAKLLGVSKGVISRRLNGSANITLKTLSNMATAMRCKLIIKLQPYDELQQSNYISPYDLINKSGERRTETKAITQWATYSNDFGMK